MPVTVVTKTSGEKVKIAAFTVTAIVILAGLAVIFFAPSHESTGIVKVACVGDSITEITGYPEDLQNLLGNGYDVENFGVIGATILFNTDRPYISQPGCTLAEQFQPQVVVIMLGTNDARTTTYQNSSELELNFRQLIAAFQDLASKPKVLVATPPPLFSNTLGLNITDLVDGVIPRVQQVANSMHAPIIDVYSALLNYSAYFPDGVHPNSLGAQKIAQVVFDAVVKVKA